MNQYLKKNLFNNLALMLIICDISAIFMSLLTGFFIRCLFPGSIDMLNYLPLAFFMPIVPIIYWSTGAYQSMLHPSEEIKRLSVGSSIIFLILTSIFFILKTTDNISRVFFILSWLLALLLTPTFRVVVLGTLAKKKCFMKPLLIIATQQNYSILKRNFANFREKHFTPVAIISPITKDKDLAYCEQAKSLPTYEIIDGKEDELAKLIHSQFPDALVIIHNPSLNSDSANKIFAAFDHYFKRTCIIPESSWLYSISSKTVMLDSYIGIAIEHNLTDKRLCLTKRIIDLIMVFCSLPLLLPFFALIGLLIKLDDKGPIFFKQKRIGIGGKPFYVYKFRTMATNAAKLLEELLANDEEAAREWKENQKLKNDPRITRVGKFLRKTSLDELAQLVNVVKGEMSLVGPRPIVEEEIQKYHENYTYYTRVTPGITGLWQVSGRNDTTYQERVELDVFYINNWSIWLDIYILCKTFPEVIRQKGAY